MRRRMMVAGAAVAVVIALGASVLTAMGGGKPPADGEGQRFNLAVLGNAFTFQGALNDGTSPANGPYDFRFILYDDAVAGSQVGPIETEGDLQVTGGIFTAQLDFGANAFNGEARWIEVQVRPGASSGTYTVLSPRQPIAATPYALYAKTIPLFGQSFSGGATTGLTLNSSAANGNGLVVHMDATTGVGVFSSMDAGSGGAVAVEGYTTSAAGTAGRFLNLGGAGATALEGVGNGAGTTALELNNGALKVSGGVRPAFEFTATAGTISGHVATIDHPLTNNNANAIVLVTPLWEGVYNAHPIGVWYAGNRWTIFNQDIAPMPVNAKFNVLVIDQ